MAMQAQPVGSGRVARAAALAYVAPAVGFGIPIPFAMAYLARTGQLPMTPFGFRAYDGPIARSGQDAFRAVGVVLVGSCLIDVVSGIGLWRGRRRAAVVGLAATPLTLAMAYSFELPFLFAAIPIRVALAAGAWPTLR
jgi:hypothetical protein